MVSISSLKAVRAQLVPLNATLQLNKIPYAIARLDRRGMTKANELPGVGIVVNPKTSRIFGRRKQGGVVYIFVISVG